MDICPMANGHPSIDPSDCDINPIPKPNETRERRERTTIVGVIILESITGISCVYQKTFHLTSGELDIDIAKIALCHPEPVEG